MFSLRLAVPASQICTKEALQEQNIIYVNYLSDIMQIIYRNKRHKGDTIFEICLIIWSRHVVPFPLPMALRFEMCLKLKKNISLID